MEKLEWIPDQEIDRCFKALLDEAATTEETLEYLTRTDPTSNDYHFCVDLIAEDTLRLCKEGYLHRWDFDPSDIGHSNQSILDSGSPWPCLKKWDGKKKREILYCIVGAYSRKCHTVVKRLINEFHQVQNSAQLRQLEDQAFALGVFIRQNGRMRHNCSFIDAKKVFEACQNAWQSLS